MIPSTIAKKATHIRNSVGEKRRINVTELARSKEWRTQLPKCDIIEITDRGENTGWLVSNAGMDALLGTIDDLEQQLEQTQVAAIVNARADYQNWRSGKELIDSALEILENQSADIRTIIDNDHK